MRPHPLLLTASLLALPLLAWSQAWGSGGRSGNAQQEHYEIDIYPGIERTDLQVTRSFSNPGLGQATLEIDLHLPCEASLSELRVLDGSGAWIDAQILEPRDADLRWQGHLADAAARGPGESQTNGDTAVLLSRDSSCEATLELYPIPPLQTRTLSYRLSFEPDYDDGSYSVALPRFQDIGEAAELKVHQGVEPGLSVAVNDLSLGARAQLELDGRDPTSLTMVASDPLRGLARAADLDLASLGAASSSRRLVAANLDLPRTLATLPPVRRVTVIVDASRSLEGYERKALTTAAAAYLERLGAEQPEAKAEILLVDREVRPFYYGYVPASWAADALLDLEFEAQNGSELGAALDAARALMAADRVQGPTQAKGGLAPVDWVLLLSDFELRADFELEDQRRAADASAVHMHVARVTDDDGALGFSPDTLSETWTAMAHESGGMGWRLDPSDADPELVGSEWLAPRRVWGLEFVREDADAHRERIPLAEAALAGTRTHWGEVLDEAPQSTRALFSGAVWGQTRSWVTAPDLDYGLGVAATAAMELDDYALSTEEREALAIHAQVVSRFTSAFALAAFAGPPAPPSGPKTVTSRTGRGGSGGCSMGFGARCGGVRMRLPTLEEGLAAAIAACPDAPAGELHFEVHAPEILAVDSLDRCLEEALWAVDLRDYDPVQDGLVVLRHGGGAAAARDGAASLSAEVVAAERRSELLAKLK
ncbi:hypothetical protein G6O69_24500 [Pseudenhygromyxa sp. WMMC2535]|uniref:hypothetical protein n=1 Tax=Pseudenhygromyxa sp. WMMC2535 TaxID=2712867 RepID=UPI001557196B|nr:hypothetical protein [Pseudenhygromyxa sp. WMMC2535]NVB41024.1 hypothetical protein [Pseudenhygromyxa sp. WMMC2535]